MVDLSIEFLLRTAIRLAGWFVLVPVPDWD